MSATLTTEAKLKYVHRAIVVLSSVSRFPIDMLRYDRCTPATESDSHSIEDSFDSRDVRGPIGKREVGISKYSEHKDWDKAFTTDRWKSFGCTLKKPLPY